MSQVHIYQASREEKWSELAQDYQKEVCLLLLWYVGLAVMCRWKPTRQNIIIVAKAHTFCLDQLIG